MKLFFDVFDIRELIWIFRTYKNKGVFLCADLRMEEMMDCRLRLPVLDE